MKTLTVKQLANIFSSHSGQKEFPLYEHIHGGNKKIPKTTAIFNMGSATHCPALALGLCKAYNAKGIHVCYAMKGERLYPQVLPYRVKQQKFWKTISASEFAFQFIMINSLKCTRWDKLRLNESGDFHTQKCVDKAEEIAKYLIRDRIKTYCYTHRSDLDFTGCRHLIVNGSNFRKPGVVNEFRMLGKRDKKPKGYMICKNDCRVCDRCSIRGSKIVVYEH